MAPRCLALLLPLTASACIDAPVAGELQLEDLALQGEAGWLARPDQVRGETPPPAPRPVATAGAIPRVVVGPLGAAPVDEYGLADGAARCPFEVEALGFPAVTTDGTRAVASVRYVPSASDGEDERMAVFWRAVEDDAMLEERTVFDGMESGGFSREPGNCAALHARARRAAAAINVRLAEDEWRTMHPLAIGIHDEGWFDYDVEARQDLLTRAPSDRPPELTWRWGSLVDRKSVV